MKRLPFSRFDSASVPDFWPGKALRATINESRPAFYGKRVLVTGACGFVGGHLTRALEAAGAHVVALDNDINPARGCQLDLTGVRDRVEMFEGDITQRLQIEELILEGEFSHIFHLAAGATTVEKAMTDPYGTIMANTMGFVNLAEGARLLPEEKRPVIVYASTDKVYGEAETLPYTEEHELAGVGVYDAAKLCADILSATYHKALNVPTVVLRMCNIFGPYDLNFNYRLIPKAMRNIFRDGESPELYMNSIEHFRDYLYVEDAVRAYFHIARNPNCYGRAYNLPGAHYSSTPDVLRDIVTFIGDLQDKEYDIDPSSALSQHHWNRSIRIVPSDPKLITISKQHLDGTRIEREAGFTPMTTFYEGLAATAKFYLWYFNEIEKKTVQPVAPLEIPIVIPAVKSYQASEDSSFETIFTDDGLPVHRLKPSSFERELEDESFIPKPTTFLTEAYLATAA